MKRRPPISPLFPYPPLSRSAHPRRLRRGCVGARLRLLRVPEDQVDLRQTCEILRLDLRRAAGDDEPCVRPDRKSTRLNSSHANISYAVFCLKKKKTQL